MGSCHEDDFPLVLIFSLLPSRVMLLDSTVLLDLNTSRISANSLLTAPVFPNLSEITQSWADMESAGESGNDSGGGFRPAGELEQLVLLGVLICLRLSAAGE